MLLTHETIHEELEEWIMIMKTVFLLTIYFETWKYSLLCKQAQNERCCHLSYDTMWLTDIWEEYIALFVVRR